MHLLAMLILITLAFILLFQLSVTDVKFMLRHLFVFNAGILKNAAPPCYVSVFLRQVQNIWNPGSAAFTHTQAPLIRADSHVHSVRLDVDRH